MEAGMEAAMAAVLEAELEAAVLGAGRRLFGNEAQ